MVVSRFGKLPLGRPKIRYQCIINIYLSQIRCGEGRQMQVTQDRILWPALSLAVLNLQIVKTNVIA
jgi:hypothetical protein